jgi:hypothetical protein
MAHIRQEVSLLKNGLVSIKQPNESAAVIINVFILYPLFLR